MELHKAKFIIEKYGSTDFIELNKKQLSLLNNAMNVINFNNKKISRIVEISDRQIRELRKKELIHIVQITTMVYKNNGGV